MSLNEARLPSLKDKLETKAELEKEIAKVDEEIEEITAVKKVKIKSKPKKR